MSVVFAYVRWCRVSFGFSSCFSSQELESDWSPPADWSNNETLILESISWQVLRRMRLHSPKWLQLDRVHGDFVRSHKKHAEAWILSAEGHLFMGAIIAFQSLVLGAEVSLELEVEETWLKRWAIGLLFLDVLFLFIFFVEYILRSHALRMQYDPWRFVTLKVLSASGLFDLLLLVTGLFAALVAFLDLLELPLPELLMTCNVAMSACEKAEQWQQLFVLLDKQLEPNLITYNAVLSGCALRFSSLAWYCAIDVLHQISARRLEANALTYQEALRSAGSPFQGASGRVLLDKLRRFAMQELARDRTPWGQG
eukprot:g25811.t1